MGAHWCMPAPIPSTYMRKVLTISYFYPPFDCTAAVEASKFTKFLPHHGWSPIVVTADSDYPRTLSLEIPQQDVYRTKQIDINRLPKLLAGRERVQSKGFVTDDTVRGKISALLGYWYRQIIDFPDAQIGWYPYALRTARRLINEHRPAALMSSAWPVTNHLVASRLAKEENLPWLADFRDLWTANHHFQRRTPLRSIEARLERRTMRPARATSAPSEEWAQILASSFSKRAVVLPNGFDPEDYPSLTPNPGRFVLTYTGMFYPEKQDPYPLLRAIARLKQDGIVKATNFELRLVGRYLDYLKPALAELDIEDVTNLFGMVSHRQALGIQKESSALVFLLWTRPEGRGWFSAKLYEYLGAGRPILAIGSRNTDAARYIRETEAGVVHEDPREIAMVLKSWIENPESAPVADRNTLLSMEWHSIVRRLAGVLDEITSS